MNLACYVFVLTTRNNTVSYRSMLRYSLKQVLKMGHTLMIALVNLLGNYSFINKLCPLLIKDTVTIYI